MGSKQNNYFKCNCYVFRTRNVVRVFDEENFTSRRRRVPKGRSGHRITSCETYLYTFGGYNPIMDDYSESDYELRFEDEEMLQETRLFKEIWRFNMITKRWTGLNMKKEDFPRELASITLQKWGNNMIIHGGTGIPFGISSSNVTYSARFPSCRLMELPTTGTLPVPMYGQASAIDHDNKRLYLVGGTSGVLFSMDVHYLDLKTFLWTKVIPIGSSSDVPDGRYRHEIALYDSKIFVFGGGTVDVSFDFLTVPVFDLKTQSWAMVWTKGYRKSRKEQPRFPKPRRCHAGVFVPPEDGEDPEFIICGGFDGRHSFSDIWSLNLRTRQWLLWKSSLPNKLYFHDASLTPQGRMVVFGGIVDDSNRTEPAVRTNQVVAFWVKIPKLSEIAWEAVLHYTPAIAKLSEKELGLMGIPRSFAIRLL